MISSMTRKSAVSRSISTRAYFAEPGCFLYADRSASSSAIISFSGSMPFSRASAFIASRISRDMCLLLHQVGSLDGRIGNRDDSVGRGERALVRVRPHELTRDTRALTDHHAGRGPHLRAATDEALEV